MRNVADLHPELQAKVAKLKTECEKAGLKIGIGECYRTVAEQDALYAKGRTTAGAKVTNAKGSSYSSMHQWYVAFDFYRNDGKGAYYDSDGFFTKVGKIGQKIGLEWGGAWTTIKDKPHFQLSNWGSTPAKLKKMYGTPAKFKANWSKETSIAKATIKQGAKGDNVKHLQENLNQCGANLVCDGSAGTKTIQALKDWQRRNSLVCDGSYGSKSEAKMRSLLDGR